MLPIVITGPPTEQDPCNTSPALRPRARMVIKIPARAGLTTRRLRTMDPDGSRPFSVRRDHSILGNSRRRRCETAVASAPICLRQGKKTVDGALRMEWWYCSFQVAMSNGALVTHVVMAKAGHLIGHAPGELQRQGAKGTRPYPSSAPAFSTPAVGALLMRRLVPPSPYASIPEQSSAAGASPVMGPPLGAVRPSRATAPPLTAP